MNKNESKKILIIDDNVNIRASLRMALELFGFEIFEAANGQEGLSLLQKIIPSIILLDLMMPVMNGWQFVDSLAQEKTLSTIPIVVLTAFIDKVKTIKANAFVAKPFEFTHLLEVINSIMLEDEKIEC